MKFRKQILLILKITASILCSGTILLAQSSTTLPKPQHAEGSSAQKAGNQSNKNIESFELVWKTIKDSHWLPEKVGESWDADRKELYPLVAKANSKSEARGVINELIGRLKQSHFAVLPSDSLALIDGEGGGSFNIGLTVRLVEGQLVVTAVRPGSAAADANVRPGWAIQRIRKYEAAQLIEKINQLGNGPQRPDTTIGTTMDRYCSGRRHSKINVTFADHANQLRGMNLACISTVPGKVVKFGNLPPIRVNAETRTLESNIGYYAFNAFLDPVRVMTAYNKVIADPNHSGGIILDLRGNIGGLVRMTMGMTRHFVTEKRKLGTLLMKDSELEFIANPRAVTYQAPVAVLIDECSISAAEIFAGGLKDLGLARVFGQRSAGLALPSTTITLPNGDGLQYAFADYISAGGETLELKGVVPDEEIKLTRQSLLEKGDPTLGAAVDWIKSQQK